MRGIISLVIIVVGSFIIATGVGVWAASNTNHPAVGVKAAYVADFQRVGAGRRRARLQAMNYWRCCQFDTLQSAPGWRETECNSIS